MKFISFLLLFIITGATATNAQVTLQTPGVQSILYTGTGSKQPLIVGFGGSEGGNAWSSNYWKPTRDKFLAAGYAFLAIGYFKAPGAPDTLNNININAVHDAILKAAAQPNIDAKKIAIIGGSRGADLALLLASHFSDIRCVVSIVGSSAVFPGHTSHFTTSAWVYNGQPLPFLPVNEAAVPFLMKRDLRGTFEAMLKDSAAAEKAAIPVEKIKGPVLFLSAQSDEICPSTPMAETMVLRMARHNTPYYVEHIVVEGRHAAPLKRFDDVFAFLEKHFR